MGNCCCAPGSRRFLVDIRFAGGPFDWFSPFSILVALGVVFGYVLLGATYLIIKTEGVQQEHSVRMAWVAGALMLAAAADPDASFDR